MNFFSWLNGAVEDGRPKTQRVRQPEAPISTPMYTSKDVIRDLNLAVCSFIANIKQDVEKIDLPIEIKKDSGTLSEFGFTNAKNTQLLKTVVNHVESHNRLQQEQKSLVAFIKDVKRIFGESAVVVSYTDFFKLLEKYDMVCGSFDRYTGSIPREVLGTLSDLKYLWLEHRFPKEYWSGHSYISYVHYDGSDTDKSRLIKNARMPFKAIDGRITTRLNKIALRDDNVTGTVPAADIKNVLFIAAPVADMKPLEVRLSAGSIVWAADWRPKVEADFRQSELSRYYKLRSQPAQNYRPTRKVIDPFICSLTAYGVLIHAKWGGEAEDATIKLYEQLREAITTTAKLPNETKA